MICSFSIRNIHYGISLLSRPIQHAFLPTSLTRYFRHDTSRMRRFYRTTSIALASSAFLFSPAGARAYQHIDPSHFVKEQSPKILSNLGANASMLKLNAQVNDQMTRLIQSHMVQGMAKGTLKKEEWETKYMKPDVLYIYQLGQSLRERAKKENEEDCERVMEMADMFLGYGKHFQRLKKYGLSSDDKLVSPRCDEHIALLSQKTSPQEFYVSILTDMIPYVVFANYLLHSIEPSDQNPWMEYARKYGDLNNKYAREKLGKMIQVANQILAKGELANERAEELFVEGFSFEEWFVQHAFKQGFHIEPTTQQILK